MNLAGRVVGFFEDGYWRAEDARDRGVASSDGFDQRPSAMLRRGSVEGDPMTADGRPGGGPPVDRPLAAGWNPVLTVRAMHIVLWLLVISGPVTALLVANQVSSLGDRLDLVRRRGRCRGAARHGWSGGFRRAVHRHLPRCRRGLDRCARSLPGRCLAGWSRERIVVGDEDDEPRSRGGRPRLLRGDGGCRGCRHRSRRRRAARVGSGRHPLLLGWRGRDDNWMGHHRSARH